MAVTRDIKRKQLAAVAVAAKALSFFIKPGSVAAGSLFVAWLTWQSRQRRGQTSKALQLKLTLPPVRNTGSPSNKPVSGNAREQLQVYVLPDTDTGAEMAAESIINKHMPLWHIPTPPGTSDEVNDNQKVHQAAAETVTDRPGRGEDGNAIHVLGFDTEWDSHLHIKPAAEQQPETRRCQVAVLQLSGKDWCMVLRPHRLKEHLPSTLVQLLEDPAVLKAGVGIQEDAKRLAADWGVAVRGLIDVRLVAQLVLPEVVLEVGQSLSGLTRAVLGRELDKSMQRSHWGANKLTKAQLTYAAQDAWASQALLLALFEHACRTLPSRHEQPNRNNSTATDSTVDHADELIHSTTHNDNAESWTEDTLLRAFVQPFNDSFKLKSVQQRIASQQASGQWPFATAQGFSFHRGSSPAGFNSNDKRVNNNDESANVGNKKPSRHALRKTILYENCRIQAPDGTVLCTCSSKKIQWYLNRSLGELVCEDPMTLRLHFEPKGRGHSDDQYYVSDKMNQCVVCGVSSHDEQKSGPTIEISTTNLTDKPDSTNTTPSPDDDKQFSGYHSIHVARTNGNGVHSTDNGNASPMSDVTHQDLQGSCNGDSVANCDQQQQPGLETKRSKSARARAQSETQAYLRHSVVPACYRRCFPTTFKSHLSHDIVLLCSDCAQVCSMKDQKRMAVLGQQLNAPLSEDNSRYKHDAMMNSVRNAARALQNTKVQLPAQRKEELKKVIADYFRVQPEQLGTDLIDQAGSLDPRKPAEEWKSHAEKVVDTLKTTADFEAFVRGWRAHFLDSMKPRFLPPYWSVDARVQNSSYKPKDVPLKQQ